MSYAIVRHTGVNTSEWFGQNGGWGDSPKKYSKAGWAHRRARQYNDSRGNQPAAFVVGEDDPYWEDRKEV